jgi:dihydrofolate reductase
MMKISLVVAMSRQGVIGRDGGLPWHISSDLRRFKAITMGKPIIMGRKTWESLPKKPLPGRQNIIITRQPDYHAKGGRVAASLEEAVRIAGNVGELAVIGGGEIYRLAFPMANRIYLTEVDLDVEGDTRFPAVNPGEWLETARERHEAGPSDSVSFTLRTLDRLK